MPRSREYAKMGKEYEKSCCRLRIILQKVSAKKLIAAVIEAEFASEFRYPHPAFVKDKRR